MSISQEELEAIKRAVQGEVCYRPGFVELIAPAPVTAMFSPSAVRYQIGFPELLEHIEIQQAQIEGLVGALTSQKMADEEKEKYGENPVYQALKNNARALREKALSTLPAEHLAQAQKRDDVLRAAEEFKRAFDDWYDPNSDDTDKVRMAEARRELFNKLNLLAQKGE